MTCPYARERLWSEPGVVDALDALWPLLTPERLLAELLRSPAAIRSAAGSVFSDIERTLLSRPDHPARWTVADVPLLDELAELLGVDDSAAKAARRALERAQRLETQYAQDVLDSTGVADLGLVDAETLAAWNRDNGPSLSTAERAGADRSWAYGHVIIDEAQELSAMAWRMVLRRNPARSMTVVGDVAQTGSPAGARSWKAMLNPLVGGRWREQRLTVNYRTPSEIMTAAADVLASVAPDERPPESVRSEGVGPRAIAAAAGRTGRGGGPRGPRRPGRARRPGRRPAGDHRPRRPDRRLAAAIGEATPGDRPESLDAVAALLTVSQAKGLSRVLDPANSNGQYPNGGRYLR